MKPIFEHTCLTCGHTDETRFEFAGQHIKAVCNHCRRYIKFFDKSKVPDILEIRRVIWSISNQNKDLIEKAKRNINFVSDLYVGWQAKVIWWQLYMEVRKIRIEIDNEKFV